MNITAAPTYARDRAQIVEPTIVVTSTTGVRFRARILRSGDRYGRNNVLTWDEEERGNLGVEFYDTRFQDGDFGPYGQFVSRYYIETLLGEDMWGGHPWGGLDLMGYADSWKIDADAMDVVRAWLRLERGRDLVEA